MLPVRSIKREEGREGVGGKGGRKKVRKRGREEQRWFGIPKTDSSRASPAIAQIRKTRRRCVKADFAQCRSLASASQLKTTAL